jgi:hypothetical protein
MTTSEDVQLFTAGIRLENGRYSEFIQSRNEVEVEVEVEVDEYINIMKSTKSKNSEIVKMINLTGSRQLAWPVLVNFRHI